MLQQTSHRRLYTLCDVDISSEPCANYQRVRLWIVWTHVVPPRPSHACGPHMLSFFNGSRKRFVCSANVRVQFSNNRRMKYETLCRRGRTWWKWMLIRTMAADAGSPDAFAHFPQDLLYSPRAFDLSTWGCITLLLGSLTRSQPSAS